MSYDKLIGVLKHLPGHHDQTSHGRGKGSYTKPSGKLENSTLMDAFNEFRLLGQGTLVNSKTKLYRLPGNKMDDIVKVAETLGLKKTYDQDQSYVKIRPAITRSLAYGNDTYQIVASYHDQGGDGNYTAAEVSGQ